MASVEARIAGLVGQWRAVAARLETLSATVDPDTLVQNCNIDQIAGPGTIDTFGTMIVGQRKNQIDVQFFLAAPADIFRDYNPPAFPYGVGGSLTLSGTATASARAGGADFKSGDGYAVAETGVTTVYSSGAEVYCEMTAAWTTPPNAGATTARATMGLYSGETDGTPGNGDGFFFGFINGDFVAGLRNFGTDSTTTQGNFSEDDLTGGTASKFTRDGAEEAIDFTLTNVFRIRFGWLGSAPISFDVLAPDGHWVTFHKIKQPNLSSAPHIQNPNLPLRCEVIRGDASAEVVLTTNCWGAGVTVDYEPIAGGIDFTDRATLVRSVITGEHSGGGGGFVNVKVNNSGALTVEAEQGTHDNFQCNANLQVGDNDVTDINAVPVTNDSTGTLTVDGTVTADLGATDNAVLDAIAAGYKNEAGAVTDGVLIQGDDGAARKNVNVDPVTGDVQVDVTNTVTVQDGGNVISVDDNDAALTVDNDGTFVVQVDGAALTALQLIDDVVHAAEATPDKAALVAGEAADYTQQGLVEPGSTTTAAKADNIAITTDREVVTAVRRRWFEPTLVDTDYDGSTTTKTSGAMIVDRYREFCLQFDLSKTNTPTDITIDVMVSGDGTNYAKLMNDGLGSLVYSDSTVGSGISRAIYFRARCHSMQIVVTATGTSGTKPTGATFTMANTILSAST